jgi:hypothetical protein
MAKNGDALHARKAMAMDAVWGRLKKLVSDNSMSIALFSLFLLCVVGQGLSGWSAYNGSLKAAHLRPLRLGAYLGTGNFLDGILSNWQAAILQLAVLIAFGSVLRQKGAAHSRQPEPDSHAAKVLSQRTVEWKLGLRSTAKDWLYGNSLSLAALIHRMSGIRWRVSHKRLILLKDWVSTPLQSPDQTEPHPPCLKLRPRRSTFQPLGGRKSLRLSMAGA